MYMYIQHTCACTCTHAYIHTYIHTYIQMGNKGFVRRLRRDRDASDKDVSNIEKHKDSDPDKIADSTVGHDALTETQNQDMHGIRQNSLPSKLAKGESVHGGSQQALSSAAPPAANNNSRRRAMNMGGSLGRMLGHSHHDLDLWDGDDDDDDDDAGVDDDDVEDGEYNQNRGSTSSGYMCTLSQQKVEHKLVCVLVRTPSCV
jgi:hypothetical protein